LISRDRLLRVSALDQEFPELARRLRGADEIGKERGGVTMTRRLKKVHRGPVVLVGDASGSVDAITGEGLGLGFRQALALASAMESGDLSRYELAHRKLAARPARMARLMLLLDNNSTLRRRAINAFSSHPGLFHRLLNAHSGGASPVQIASAGAALGWRLVRA
jgi:flavin-dependent dehydrogenase